MFGLITAKALAAEQEVLLNKEVEEIQIEENYIEEQKEESVIVEQKQQKQAGRSSYSAAKTNYAYVAPHRKKDRNWSIGLLPVMEPFHPRLVWMDICLCLMVQGTQQ